MCSDYRGQHIVLTVAFVLGVGVTMLWGKMLLDRIGDSSHFDRPQRHHVWATRIGLVGETTASGHEIREGDVFVALPHRSALGRTVAVWHEGDRIRAKVRDVGPWHIRDAYWRHNARPQAEHDPETRNPAGIDLSNGAWDRLDIERGKGVASVRWRFVGDEP